MERHLYVGVDAKDKSVCPLELRSGMIAGYFTPGESESLFAEFWVARTGTANLPCAW